MYSKISHKQNMNGNNHFHIAIATVHTCNTRAVWKEVVTLAKVPSQSYF